MRRRGRRATVLAVGLATALATSACDLSQLGNLEFSKDNRLSFTAPAARTLVKLPLTVDWRMSGFTPSGEDGTHGRTTGVYGVFVDRAPVAVGKNLRSVADGDAGCDPASGCPDTAYFQAKGIYLTTKPSITLTELPPAPNSAGDEQHQVTVILLDGSGVRRSESAWHVNFRFPRRASL